MLKIIALEEQLANEILLIRLKGSQQLEDLLRDGLEDGEYIETPPHRQPQVKGRKSLTNESNMMQAHIAMKNLGLALPEKIKK